MYLFQGLFAVLRIIVLLFTLLFGVCSFFFFPSVKEKMRMQAPDVLMG